MRKYLFLIVVLLTCLSTVARAGLDKDAMKATSQEFNTDFRPVRTEFLDFQTYTLLVDGRDFTCHIPQALRRLAADGARFRIRKVHTKRDHFRVELETRGKRRLTIRAYDRGKLSQEFLDTGLPQLLNDIFEFGPTPAPMQFVGHTESRLLHLGRCNHLPAKELQEVFSKRQTALAAGFRECPICFQVTQSLPYPGYLSYRIQGLQGARTFELIYPVSPDQELQNRLDRLGAEVLDHWPLTLSGFDYDFRVVEADQPLAVSFPTGIVLVSDTMLESADAEEEILLVLAHEIAHCELHLPPRSPFAGKRFFSSMDKGFSAYLTWTSNMQLAADLVAVAWFQGSAGATRDLARARAAMAKVQQAVGATDQLYLEAGQSLSLHERFWLFESNRFQPGDLRQVFVAVDGERDIRYEVRFLGLIKDEEEKDTVPYFLLTTTDYQEEEKYLTPRNTGGTFEDAKGKRADFFIKPVLSAPGFTTLVIGRTQFGDYFDKFTPGPLLKAKIHGLDGVKNWGRLKPVADKD